MSKMEKSYWPATAKEGIDGGSSPVKECLVHKEQVIPVKFSASQQYWMLVHGRFIPLSNFVGLAETSSNFAEMSSMFLETASMLVNTLSKLRIRRNKGDRGKISNIGMRSIRDGRGRRSRRGRSGIRGIRGIRSIGGIRGIRGVRDVRDLRGKSNTKGDIGRSLRLGSR